MSIEKNTVRRSMAAALALLVMLGGFWVFFGQLSRPVNAVAGINEQINFQGRLFNAQGAVVPDGLYNIQFKIYQDGDGLSVGNTTGSPAGSLKWTESWLNNNSQGIQIKNGYMSANLGSINAFASQIDWNQNTLWLSMNIGSTNATCTSFTACTPDGEMVPMKRMSSTPYSMNSGNSNKLGGLTSGQFVQLAQGVQTDASTASSIFLNKTSTGNFLQLQAGGTDVFNLTNSGDILLGNNANHTLSIATSAASVAGRNMTMSAGTGGSGTGSTGGTLTLQGGTAGGTNGNGGDVSIDAGAKTGTGTGGSINVGGANASSINVGNTGTTATIRIGNSTGAVAQTINVGTNATASSITTLTMGSAISSSSTTIAAGTGGLSMGTANVPNTIQLGSTTLSTGTQTINIGNNSTGGGTTNVTIGSGSGATAGTTTLQGKSSLILNTNGIARGTFDTNGALYLGNGVNSTAPSNFTVSGTQSATTAIAGGALTVQGGNATVGNANGGNVTLSGGTGVGTGVNGLVVITTPTFQTASSQSCATNCTVTQANVDSNSAVIINATAPALTATLPDPTITTAGRIVYVTAANGSNDFTLSVNGGGVGNQIAMRQNTTATMVWNGSDWTAAGASSSTTLQAAYDNTLTSAGGAELLLSNGANANGLTIRDSSVNPVNGTLLEVQNSSAANLFSVNSNVTEYASNAGAETAGGSSTTFPSNTWSALTGATVSRYVTAGNYVATGQASVSTVTTATANAGIDNQLVNSAGAAAALNANTTYNVSFATRLLSGTFTDMYVQYSMDGTTTAGSLTSCTTNATSTTSVWSKVNCTFTTPTTGITSANGIFIRQAGATARTFYVDNLSVTIAADYNFATDGNVSDNTNFTTNWSYSTGTGTGTVTRNTGDGYNASDSAQVAITAGAANAGVRNKLRSNPLPGTLYRMTAYAKLSSGTFTDFKIRYSRDGGTNFIDCVDYNTQTITTTAWTKITCYVTTDGTAASNPYVYFSEGSAAARTYSVDAFSMTLRTATTPNVQIGGGVNGGPTTLLTLDKGASAPIASDNDALLGSMYYDTTLGKLQCYEADGWGACGSSPDNVITLSPEFNNAVMQGPSGGTPGIGTMTSALCSDTLNINDGSSSQPTICGSNETYNYYKWTSPQASAQTYGVYVTYQLPSTFKEFASGSTSLRGRSDSGSSGGSANVTYKVYRNNPATGLTQCGSAVAVSSGTVSSWQTGLASGAADPSTCGFLPGDSILFEIDMVASSTANAYVSNLNFTFSNR